MDSVTEKTIILPAPTLGTILLSRKWTYLAASVKWFSKDSYSIF